MLKKARTVFQRFVESESSGGLVLMASAVLGMIVANSPLADDYDHILHMELGGLSVLHWINDGLMALFFLLVGLEIKREMLVGELNNWPRRALPLVAAFGGMIAPALIFIAINFQTPETWRGWAVPTATDIAFALGVLSLFGSRIPSSLKVFLTSLAIIDDLGAILIIAIFYAKDLSMEALGLSALAALVLFGFNWFGVKRLVPYLAVGLLLWVAMLFSGVHATLAGVVLALTIPLGDVSGAHDDKNGTNNHDNSPLYRLEDALGLGVAFIIVPLFGFANAGVSLQGVTFDMVVAPLSLGIMLGLFVGKQLGIMTFVVTAYRAGIVHMPAESTWREVYGVAILCGIGFTMSLFIGLLAFDDAEHISMTKLAVLCGSVISAIVGAAVLLWPKRRREVAAS